MQTWKRFGLVGAVMVIVAVFAVAFFASAFAPSTGADSPEDGGNLSVILAALVFLGGAYLVARDTRRSKERNDVRASTWWQVPATITHSELRTMSDGEAFRRLDASLAAGFDHPRGKSDDFPKYLADIRYEYAVGVRRFVGDRVGVSEDYTRSGATAIVERYAPGDRVTAWVDPSEHGRAVLDLGYVYTAVRALWEWISILVAIGVLLLALGTGVIAFPAN